MTVGNCSSSKAFEVRAGFCSCGCESESTGKITKTYCGYGVVVKVEYTELPATLCKEFYVIAALLSVTTLLRKALLQTALALEYEQPSSHLQFFSQTRGGE